jgi:RNA polymerase sigma-70 factor, ECF subfamily
MPKTALTESEIKNLVARAQEGDREAFGKLYEEYFDSIYRYTAFRLSTEITEDTVADIFVKAWEKLHTYKRQKSVPFGAWLFRIARYTVIDVYRTHRGFEEVPESIEDPDTLNRAETRTYQQDTMRIVRTAMDKLPRRYREVLVLSFLSELPHKSIASVLKMTEGGVRILKLRALKKLESLLPSDVKEK